MEKRNSTADLSTGSRESTVLSVEENRCCGLPPQQGCCRSTIASTRCSRRPASDALPPLSAGKHRPIARCRRRQAGEKSRENEPDHQDATVKRFHYDDRDQLRRHLADFVAAYNFGRKLKTLKGLTPCEFIWKAWASQPERSLSIRSSKCRDFSIRRVEVNRFQASSTTGI